MSLSRSFRRRRIAPRNKQVSRHTVPAQQSHLRLSRGAWLAGTSVLALMIALPSARAVTVGGSSTGAVVSAPAVATDAALAAAKQAQQAAQNAQQAMARATKALQSLQSVQAAARAAAQAAQRSTTLPQVVVPNGLTPGGLVPNPVAGWSGANAPTQAAGTGGQINVDVNQTAAKAILNWNTFNVGTHTTLTFDQHGNSDWVALNRVTGNLGPSQILGNIRADGQVLVINQNGIIFGGASQINVGSLVASTLGITDQQFLTGIVNAQPYDIAHQKISDPIFSSAGAPAGDITVEAGAVIRTAPPKSVTTGGGSVYLFGNNVSNSGTIVTPDGQTVLAAGSAVYITQSTDPHVRGVEINLLNGGSVTNTSQGYISAPTGNISLVGINVKQAGVLTATTSVDEAGSINLIAHDGSNSLNIYTDNYTVLTYYVLPTRLGTVELSPGSVTAILPEENGRTALDGQPQQRSAFRAEGQTINVLAGASILAPSGLVGLDASSDPTQVYVQGHPAARGFSFSSVPDAGRVYVADGVTIDVSGLQDVATAASADAVLVNVRANELRDSPLNRSGILYGTDVWVNVHDLNRVGTDRVYTAGGLLEVSGWLGLTPRTLDQRLTAGGSVSIFSTGDAILRPGASINIAGGSLDHQAGDLPNTRLIGSDGRIYDINSALADMTYVGIAGRYTVNHSHWGISETYLSPFGSTRHQAAYIEGKSAGTFTVAAHAAEIDADVNATAVNGFYQRTAGNMAQNGGLVVGFSNGLVIPANVVIGATVTAPVDVFAVSSVNAQGARDPATLLPPDRQQTLFLSAKALDDARYGSVTITSGNVSLVQGSTLEVADGGAINLAAGGNITIGGKLIAHAGSVAFDASLGSTPSDIVLRPGSVIDVTGLWTNDALNPSSGAPLLYNGGKVTLNAKGSVLTANGALIDASGGGWLQANGKLKTDAHGLPVGKGGDITIVSNYEVQGDSGGDPIIYPGRVVLGGTLRAHGLGGGGRLTIAAPDIRIGGSDPADGTTLWLDPGFFAPGDFGQYRLVSYRSLAVAPGADLELHAQTLVPTAAALSAPTGANISGVLALGTPPSFQNAPPVNLMLSAVDPLAGNLSIGTGAQINADPGAVVSLHASHQLSIDGVINAPGGTINLDLYGPVSRGFYFPAAPYDPAQTLWIGPNARLLATGLIQTFADATGQPGYRLWNGGSVNINQNGTDPAAYPYAGYEWWGDPSNHYWGDPSLSTAPGGMPGFDPLGTIVMQAGSVIDVSGAAGAIAVTSRGGMSPQLATTPVATDAGSVNILATQGLLLDGTLLAHGGGPASAGGSLTIDQTIWAEPYVITTYQQPVGELILTQHMQSTSAGLHLGDAVPAALQGQLQVSADQIAGAGFSGISLGAFDAVIFNGDVNLYAGRSLTINAGTISATPGANVQLTSAYVDIGGGQRNSTSYYPGLALLRGTANLTVNAGLIDIEGVLRSGAAYSYQPNSASPYVDVALPGFANITFDSRGDIRLVPAARATLNTSILATLGNLNFISAQIYPTTSTPATALNGAPSQSRFLIAATGATSVIAIARNGADTPPVPLSAAGIVQLMAPTIDQGGVLRAPMGQIIFGDPTNPATAAHINLLPGSITSVSADGALIPFGSPLGNNLYIYGYDQYSPGTPNALVVPPEKLISFYGQSVNVAGAANGKAKAKIDESGGGDLYGYQFVSGAGGSVDTLNGVNTFAILPSLGSAYAPRSPLIASSNGDPGVVAPNVNLKVGDQVYLSGVAGLAAGYYTLLPGHYALLPGGFEVTIAASNLAPSQVAANQALPNGAYYVSGYRAVANTAIRDALASTFIVTPGAVVRQQSQYSETTVTKFFQSQATAANTAAPRLPVDAGRLVLNALTAITFEGESDFSYGRGGRGGQVDITGSNLEVIGSGDVATAGFIGISDALINNIGAQSVLIGGVRRIPDLYPNQILITQQAGNVEIGAHAVLAAPEIMLRATGTLTLDPGAVIDTTQAGALPDAFPTDPKSGQSLGSIVLTDGAFLMASNAPTPVRVNLTSSSQPAPSRLVIGAGARVDAGSSLTLANTSNFSLDSTAAFGAASITVAAPIINIGGQSTSGITFTPALLGALTHGDPSRGIAPATSLTLSAGQAVNVYGSGVLGTINPATGRPSLARLTLAAPVIQGFGAAGDTASITAGQLTLTGAATAVAAAGSGQGLLALNATELTLGAGSLNFGGFSSVMLNASNRLIGNGIGIYGATGAVTISTPLVTANAGADTSLNATGAVAFLGLPMPAVAAIAQVQSIGAHLTVNATTITQATDISLPSGIITLNGASGVTLAAGSVTDVSGAVVPFFDVVRIAPGGTVNLQSQTGNVAIAAGALVDLSGGDLSRLDRTRTPVVDLIDSSKGGDAGSLNIIATSGTTQLDGAFNVAAVAGYKGAQVSMNLASGDAGALLTAVRGFSEKQALTLAAGDIGVGNITAHNVELATSTGSITVSGTIDASGPDGGSIRLNAGHNLMVRGMLKASANAAAGDAGNVFLGIASNSAGTLTLAAGSSIDVTGGSFNVAQNGGKVWLRAPRTNIGGVAGVAISDAGVTVLGAREIDAEAVRVYDITANPYVDQAIPVADADAQAYMNNASGIKAAIGAIASNASFHLMPGIELQSSGDMTLLQSPSSINTGIDLHVYRYYGGEPMVGQGGPMVLTLRAAGNILFNGSLSDGFDAPVTTPDGNIFVLAPLLPRGTRSATLRVVAGANLAAADPDGVIASNLLPANTGSIQFNDPHLDVGGILIPSVLRTGTGDLDVVAARDVTLATPFGIYTAGTPSSDVAGFTSPTRVPYNSLVADYMGVPYNYLGYYVDPNTYQITNWDTLYLAPNSSGLYPSYPEKGGNLKVLVQGNLTSAQVTIPDANGTGTAYAGSASDAFWLWTQTSGPGVANGTSFINFGTYYPAPDLFNYVDQAPHVAAYRGMGALGGGNVSVSVGGNLSNVDISAPATLRAPASATSLQDVVATTGGETGGGNLLLTVGGALDNSNIDAGRFAGTVRATMIGTTAVVNLMVGDAQVSAVADRSLNLLVGDPTRSVVQTGRFPPIGLENCGLDCTTQFNLALPYGYFSSFTANTAFNVLALSGDVSLGGDYVPAITDVVAATGSISTPLHGVSPLLIALPAPTAQINLLAGVDIKNTGISMTGIVPMESVAPFYYSYAATIVNFADQAATASASNLLQPDDARTVHVYALGSVTNVTLATSKRTDVRAGLDILYPAFELQNNLATDVSLLQAGRDMSSCLTATSCRGFNVRIAGPGNLDVIAGRNITIQTPTPNSTPGIGISSIGNLDNVLLPATGASINVAVGVGKDGPNLVAFISTYLDPANAAGVLQNHTGDLVDYMRQREQNPALTAAQALADFRALSPNEQLPFVEQVYFAELKAGGEAAANGQGAGGKGYDRAYKAIQTLFPGSTIGTPTTAYRGDLSLYQLARIRTEAGGGINILAPGGSVTLGIENQTPDLNGQIDTARPGLLTLRGGSINTYTDRDVIVAQSRTFTELGGDILMFSTNGDLNAGKGKKTSLVTSPPQFTLDSYGNVTKAPVTPQTGAGIATLIGVPGVQPGNVDLFAPHGTIDAGDAGIRVSGNVTLAALQIVNASNIQVQGASVGIPTVQGPPVGALTTASNTTAASQQTGLPQQNNNDRPSILIVEIEGYGGDSSDNSVSPLKGDTDSSKTNDGKPKR
ncbi:filamentous haemagglutinin family protein [Bradyrhizobium genosp. A]|uniref:filamentous haemagglutinin family protein n=1 Tax=Bradyrhizobium genosp. A TaxID=83626 RepID=UPI003CF43BF3